MRRVHPASRTGAREAIRATFPAAVNPQLRRPASLALFATQPRTSQRLTRSRRQHANVRTETANEQATCVRYRSD